MKNKKLVQKGRLDKGFEREFANEWIGIAV